MPGTYGIQSLFRHATAFDGLSDDEVGAFTGFLRERRLEVGEVLFREGDPGASLFIILYGDVAVHVGALGDDPIRVGRLGPGDVVGEQACLDPAARSATITATSTVIGAELTREELDRMSRELPRVASLLLRVIIRALADRLRAVDRRIEAELGIAARPVSSPPPASSESPSIWQRLASRFRGAP